MVLTDQVGVGRGLVERLRKVGQACVLVEAGSEYRTDEGGEYCIRPAEPADYRRLLAELELAGEPLIRIIHCWNLDAALMSLTEQEPAHTLGAASVLFMLQAQLAEGDKLRSELWVVTRGAVAAQGSPTENALLQAPSWGLGRAATLEHPQVWGGLVDLDVEEDGSGLDRLLEEIWSPGW